MEYSEVQSVVTKGSKARSSLSKHIDANEVVCLEARRKDHKAGPSLRREKLKYDWYLLCHQGVCSGVGLSMSWMKWPLRPPSALISVPIKQLIGHQFSFSCALTLARSCSGMNSNFVKHKYCKLIHWLKSLPSLVNIRDSRCPVWCSPRSQTVVILSKEPFFKGLTSLNGIFVSFLLIFVEFC